MFTIYTQDQEEVGGAWIQEYPVTLMQFFLFLYHNQPDFVHLSSTPEFISSLAATLFPYNIVDHDVTTPTEEFKVSRSLKTVYHIYPIRIAFNQCKIYFQKYAHQVDTCTVHVLDF